MDKDEALTIAYEILALFSSGNADRLRSILGDSKKNLIEGAVREIEFFPYRIIFPPESVMDVARVTRTIAKEFFIEVPFYSDEKHNIDLELHIWLKEADGSVSNFGVLVP